MNPVDQLRDMGYSNREIEDILKEEVEES